MLAENFEIFEAGAVVDITAWKLVGGNLRTKLFTCPTNKQVKSQSM